MLLSESALYVRIETVALGIQPLPWHLGFQRDMAYRVLGCFHPSIAGQPQVLLKSERGCSCFISMCHLRAVACKPLPATDCVPLGSLVCDDKVSLEDWVHRDYVMDLTQHQALA